MADKIEKFEQRLKDLDEEIQNLLIQMGDPVFEEYERFELKQRYQKRLYDRAELAVIIQFMKEENKNK